MRTQWKPWPLLGRAGHGHAGGPLGDTPLEPAVADAALDVAGEPEDARLDAAVVGDPPPEPVRGDPRQLPPVAARQVDEVDDCVAAQLVGQRQPRLGARAPHDARPIAAEDARDALGGGRRRRSSSAASDRRGRTRPRAIAVIRPLASHAEADDACAEPLRQPHLGIGFEVVDDDDRRLRRARMRRSPAGASGSNRSSRRAARRGTRRAHRCRPLPLGCHPFRCRS